MPNEYYVSVLATRLRNVYSNPGIVFDDHFTVVDQLRYHFTVKPLALRLGEAVINEQFADTLAEHDRAFVARNLFKNVNSFFNRTSQFVNLSFDSRPDIFHCTYPMPLRVRSAIRIS